MSQTAIVIGFAATAILVVAIGYLWSRIRYLDMAQEIAREVMWKALEQHGHELDALAKRVKELEVTK